MLTVKGAKAIKPKKNKENYFFTKKIEKYRYTYTFLHSTLDFLLWVQNNYREIFSIKIPSFFCFRFVVVFCYRCISSVLLLLKISVTLSVRSTAETAVQGRFFFSTISTSTRKGGGGGWTTLRSLMPVKYTCLTLVKVLYYEYYHRRFRCVYL